MFSKKITAMLLCLLVLLPSAAAQAVKAEEYGIRFHDDFTYAFENATLRNNMAAKGWERDTLNIWDHAAYENDYNCTHEMIDDAMGGTALQLSRDKCLPSFSTPEYTYANGALECSLRLKIVDDKRSECADSYLLAIGSGCNEKFLYIQKGKMIIKSGHTVKLEKAYALDTWYMISWTVKRSGENTILSCAVKDSQGAEFLTSGDFQTNIKGSIYIGGGDVKKDENGRCYNYTYALDDVKIEHRGGQLVYRSQNFDSIPIAEGGISIGDMGVFGECDSAHAAAAIKADGYRGNALHIREKNANGFTLSTADYTPVNNFPVRIYFRFMLVNDLGGFAIDNGKGDSWIFVNKDSDGKITSKDADGEIDYRLNHWYNVTAVLKTDQTTISVTDGSAACNASRDMGLSHISIGSRSSAAQAAEGMEIAIDDVRIIIGDGTDVPLLKDSSHGSTGTAVRPDAWSIYPTMDFYFNQPVTGTISLKNDSGIVVYTSDTMTAQDVIKFEPPRLDYDTTYTVDFSEMKSLGGASAENTMLNIRTAPYYTGDMLVGDVISDTSRRALTVPVTFTSNQLEQVDVSIMAALYGDDLEAGSKDKIMWIGREKVFGRAIGDTALLYFDKLPDGFENMTLKLFAFESLETLRPIFGIQYK